MNRAGSRQSERAVPFPRSIEICILAGGLSTRMGRDKARLRLGGMTLLQRVRAVAKTLPVRVIRRDVVPRCGPLGGILTALKTSRAGAVLFLACDMPLVSTRLLQRLIDRSGRDTRAVTVSQNQRAGFPLLLPVRDLPVVERQIARGRFSIQQLAAAVKAAPLRVAAIDRQLFNVNTPQDAVEAEQLLRRAKA